MRSSICLMFLTLSIFSALAWATPLQLLEPQAQLQSGGHAYFGTVGPGQTFTVQINPIVNDEQGNFLGRWDFAYATSLPQGWQSRKSKIYDNPLVVEVTVPADSPEGEYSVSFEVVDEKGQENIGGTNDFTITVQIRHDVLEMSVDPLSASVGAGQPARFNILMHNSGSAKDVFSVKALGVKGWEFEKKVYMPPGTSKTFTYEVVGNEESNYAVKFYAVSDSSKLITSSADVTLDVRTNLASDYKATSNGIMLFPILELPLYSLAGVISFIFG
ncbi:MAG: hypothetical protein WC492_02565 [Candidatus Micrarchaeia archaeon]